MADETCGHQGQYVKLNVGGALFQTTLATLTKYDCMFRAMFSGRNEVVFIHDRQTIGFFKNVLQIYRDNDGYVFIDRSGKHFGLILNFLREGAVPLPGCKNEVQEVLIEAKYYLIQVLG
jgi:BTB/POZ domain-containing adapter for CUL3-mediated RhoA degradation protein